jgi:GNAT superfamily N-acetyltransferase
MKPLKRLGELIEDWGFLIQHDGFASALPTISSEVLQLPYRHLRFKILARTLDKTLPNLVLAPDREIRPFEVDDVDRVRVLNRPSEARSCARRLALGQLGFIAFHQLHAAGYAWGCSAIDPQLERVKIDLEPGDSLCTDAFTAPAFRGQGIQTALTLTRLLEFRDLGYHRAICIIEERNLPSLAVWQRKLTSSIIGSVDFKRIGPWYKVQFYNKGT